MAFSKSDTRSTLVKLLAFLVLSLVVVAGLVWNPVIMGIHPNTCVVSTFTGSCISTINHILHGEIGGRPCTFSLYVDSICQGAGAAVGPAGPTVLRDVLVAGGAGVVDAVDVPPVPALRELGHVQVLVRPGVGSQPRRPARGRLVAVLPFPDVEAGPTGVEAAAEHQQEGREAPHRTGHAEHRSTSPHGVLWFQWGWGESMGVPCVGDSPLLSP